MNNTIGAKHISLHNPSTVDKNAPILHPKRNITPLESSRRSPVLNLAGINSLPDNDVIPQNPRQLFNSQLADQVPNRIKRRVVRGKKGNVPRVGKRLGNTSLRHGADKSSEVLLQEGGRQRGGNSEVVVDDVDGAAGVVEVGGFNSAELAVSRKEAHAAVSGLDLESLAAGDVAVRREVEDGGEELGGGGGEVGGVEGPVEDVVGEEGGEVVGVGEELVGQRGGVQTGEGLVGGGEEGDILGIGKELVDDLFGLEEAGEGGESSRVLGEDVGEGLGVGCRGETQEGEGLELHIECVWLVVSESENESKEERGLVRSDGPVALLNGRGGCRLIDVCLTAWLSKVSRTITGRPRDFKQRQLTAMHPSVSAHIQRLFLISA